jgi:hypothetical protein
VYAPQWDLSYDEVEKHSSVYELQAEYVRSQRHTMDSAGGATAAFAEASDPEKLAKFDLERERSNVMAATAALTARAYADPIRGGR